jgi:hypothetical protein
LFLFLPPVEVDDNAAMEAVVDDVIDVPGKAKYLFSSMILLLKGEVLITA